MNQEEVKEIVLGESKEIENDEDDVIEKCNEDEVFTRSGLGKAVLTKGKMNYYSIHGTVMGALVKANS